jgi:hypothetical protein
MLGARPSLMSDGERPGLLGSWLSVFVEERGRACATALVGPRCSPSVVHPLSELVRLAVQDDL